ncbi:MAG TPA: two-component regulator propeller domain-containing protein [Phnomibacter sp.]|nr:two-component regulator propeller domain-containing protein [Phnomibacter sp.]
MKYLHIILILCWAGSSMGQQTQYNFHKLGLQDGLHDGTARRIGQDKFGYIWICSVGALNRFDGKHVVQYTNIPGDTTSPYGSQPRSVHTDPTGRLWFGFETGFAEFDFRTETFKRYPSLKDEFISRIISINDSTLFLNSRSSLIRFNTRNGQVFYYGSSKDPRHAALHQNGVNDMLYKNGEFYIATNTGLVIMNGRTEQTKAIKIPELGDRSIIAVELDSANNIWLGTTQKVKLIKLHPDLKTREIYDRFLTSDVHTQPLNVMDIMVDNRNRVWVVTAIDGLMQYRPEKNEFIKHLHNSEVPSSPSANNYRSIFQDDKGLIWLGCDYAGVNFFDPDKILFKTILPFPDRLDERARGVGRAVTEDKNGMIWMGNHDGVTRYDPTTRQYTIWRNEDNKAPILYNNVVRALHCDNENNIWIGTATGVNRYNQASRKMEFIPEKNLSLSFYNSITQDRLGNVWFCGNTPSSLEWYDPATKTFHNIFEHPQLKKYAGVTTTSYVMEDSKSRLWISYSRRGVVMLDKKSGKDTHYLANDTTGKGIIGNQVVDIKEDLDGKIWVSSFNGVTCIDPEQNTFVSYNKKSGLPGNWVSPIVVDDRNRVWLGVNGGLTMVHADRKGISRFSLSDGLPSIGFPEHAGIKTANGDIMLPTYQGYLRFDPNDFKEERSDTRFYLESYSVFNDHYKWSPEMDATSGLHFTPEQNSFTFNLAAINYLIPDETWFAYKLEGFDNNWHYTKDPKAVYTNVPGGRYTFRFKAAINNDSWDDVASKSLSVKLDTIFYKSAWFWALMLALMAGGFYALYRYRTYQARQLYLLKGQTQVLEKEKAVVMFESLKQQLNPHFLFNSLTSLSGLIETDPQEAGAFLDQMSSIYRYILRNANEESVSLKDEIAFVKLYIDLQQTRFDKGLQVIIDIPEDHLHYKIAPVTLQNLIENAIKHNIMDAESPLMIHIGIDGDHLVVRNNLQRKNVVETSNKKGLQQFISLYRFLSEKPVIIDASEKEFIIKVPLI